MRSNGPELTANALRDWCRFSGTGSSYIEPGAPWENPYVESFNGRLRDEFLDLDQFVSLLDPRRRPSRARGCAIIYEHRSNARGHVG